MYVGRPVRKVVLEGVFSPLDSSGVGAWAQGHMKSSAGASHAGGGAELVATDMTTGGDRDFAVVGVVTTRQGAIGDIAVDADCDTFVVTHPGADIFAFAGGDQKKRYKKGCPHVAGKPDNPGQIIEYDLAARTAGREQNIDRIIGNLEKVTKEQVSRVSRLIVPGKTFFLKGTGNSHESNHNPE